MVLGPSLILRPSFSSFFVRMDQGPSLTHRLSMGLDLLTNQRSSPSFIDGEDNATASTSLGDAPRAPSRKDLSDELQFHREMKEQELAPGRTGDAGAARRASGAGAPTRSREDARAIWLWPWLESAWQDGVYATSCGGSRASAGRHAHWA